MVEQFDNKAPLAAYLIGVMSEDAKAHKEAINWYEKSIDLAENSLREDWSFVWVALGDVLADNGEHEEAIKKYAHATTINEDSFYAWNNWGASLYALSDYNQAGYRFRRAIEIDPNHAFPWFAWAASLHASGDYEEAIEKIDRSIKINPNDIRAWNIWVKSLVSLGRFEEVFAVHHTWLASGGGENAARSWANSLIYYLVSYRPEAHCERGATYGPPFLEAIAGVLDGDLIVRHIHGMLAHISHHG